LCVSSQSKYDQEGSLQGKQELEHFTYQKQTNKQKKKPHGQKCLTTLTNVILILYEKIDCYAISSLCRAAKSHLIESRMQKYLMKK